MNVQLFICFKNYRQWHIADRWWDHCIPHVGQTEKNFCRSWWTASLVSEGCCANFKWANLPPVQFVHSKFVLPNQWKTTVITPVPKIASPVTCSDYRPISIIPILSRLLEKIIVSTYLYPIIDLDQCRHVFADQFAFWPTGSTAVALIQILHQVSELLLSPTFTLSL